ncbi:MAG TPA: 50S ribosome-binding GTPase, partial [Methanothrix sp.]|nr:50S ribosome-binding GTPase [Methanothrix sp.]
MTSEIVLIGRSNVGKSTLFRQLTGKKVRVGRRPGVTVGPARV